MGRVLVLALGAAALAACTTSLPAPTPPPSPPAQPVRAAAPFDLPFVVPQACVSAAVGGFALGSTRTVYRCWLDTSGVAGLLQRIRAGAAAQGWRECGPGWLFVKGDTVVAVDASAAAPRVAPPAGGRPSDPRPAEIFLTMSQATRSVPYC